MLIGSDPITSGRMSLETMRPTPTWDADAHARTVEAFAEYADELSVIVWAGDWCPDCRAVLPDFSAALEAAGVPDEAIREIAVDRDKQGPAVDAYDVEYIPTIVLERDGEEIARFVESEDQPPAQYLAATLRGL
jgi:thiol-disulfide isomerase/thioredoxin